MVNTVKLMDCTVVQCKGHKQYVYISENSRPNLLNIDTFKLINPQTLTLIFTHSTSFAAFADIGPIPLRHRRREPLQTLTISPGH